MTPLSLILFTITLLSALSIIVVGVLVFFNQIGRKESAAFLIMTFVISLWALSVSLSVGNSVSCCVSSVVGAMYIAGACIGPAFYYFVYMMTAQKSTPPLTVWSILFILVFPILMVLSLLVYPQWLLKTSDTVPTVMSFTPYALWYVGFVVIYFISGLSLLYRWYRISAGIFKSQYIKIWYHASFALIVTLFTNLLLPIFENMQEISWVGPIVVAVAVFVSGNALSQRGRWGGKLFITQYFLSLLMGVLLMQFFFVSSKEELFSHLLVIVLLGVSGFFLVRSVKEETRLDREVSRVLKDLERANMQLHSLDREKSHFMSIASHHLRDPLTAIRGYASMLLDGSYGEHVNEKAMLAIRKIYESGERLITIVNDFMTTVHIDSDDIEYVYSDVDLATLVEGTIEDYRVSMPAKNHLRLTNHKPNETYMVHVDRGKIRQVLLNMIDNACKYTPKGSIDIYIENSEKKGLVRVKVVDTGIGIDKKTLKTLFKKFSRAKGANRINTNGSGLGLYVAKIMVEKHGGVMYATSPGQGKGSTFVVELPVIAKAS